jgi:two-component system, NarL family, sensor histidine kinase DegS
LVQSDDRRARVALVLEKRKLTQHVSAEEAASSWVQERFVARARALFFARMMFLTLGLAILAVPIWRFYFHFSALAFGGYFVMLLYSVANYLVLGHLRAGRVVTYITLCLDLAAMVVVVVKPHDGGGLANPLLATQLLFTMLFALLFPKPMAILPPLLALPITARLDQLLDRSPTAVEVLTLMWYLGLNFIVIYVLVYLNEAELSAHREVVHLQGDLKELAVVEERNRLAREIHDGLGASLSSLIIQSEYVTQLTQDAAVKKEVCELKQSAEEAIEELRRSLQMMREDFDLALGVEDYVKTFAERMQVPVHFQKTGTLIARLSPETSLALFRVLQELLSNAARHAAPSCIQVTLHFGPAHVHLGVKDDGKGFDPSVPRPGHYGLINLRERAMKARGEVIVDTKPGAGTHITFTVPLLA